MGISDDQLEKIVKRNIREVIGPNYKFDPMTVQETQDILSNRILKHLSSHSDYKNNYVIKYGITIVMDRLENPCLRRLSSYINTDDNCKVKKYNFSWKNAHLSADVIICAIECSVV
ncbi:hypothetical protein ACOME3_006699 [Neoechinorhynchus agilis]